ncbi:hypothetical protein G1H11_05445 [Phytoactinopolyspora alkaliphila]|uniref:Solute-binding protein family 5 domain-containing protein n=1 Tax=Phytoactinopolyspora alkaliphila TaxID=1783498 RepID=A0A6N9YI75_9ACTN|nr:ABC transporter substrate-binding protein [Phytoactinopolyspora alkaliphila]NED94751.1 hypothetical protein [Phytoactinopolyspora alkaliphila]
MRFKTPYRRTARPAQVAWSFGVFAALTLLAACGGEDSKADGAAAPDTGQGDTLSIAVSAEPPHYSWIQGGTGLKVQVMLMHNVVEPLLERMEDGSLEPLLAEAFDVSADGLEYVFTIREAVFHDASELTAADVTYSLELSRQSSVDAIAGPLKPVETIEMVDERTVKVTLSAPSQRFLEALSRDSAFIVPEGSEDQLRNAPVGTGPFVFQEWRHGIELKLARFEDYWGDQPHFANVDFRFIEEANAQANAVQAGNIDIVDQVSGEVRQQLDGTPGYTMVSEAGQEMMWAFLNADDDLFDDERVRQAIAHSIDRDEIIAGALAGYGDPTCTYVNPPGVTWETDHCPYPHDPDRARQLLAEAGAEDLTLTMKTATVIHFPLVTEIITSQLAEAGITVDNDPVDLPTWLEHIPNADYQFTVISGSQQVDDYVCPGFWSHDCMPEFDDLLAEADHSVDLDEWADLRRQAVEMHADRAHVIPLINTLILSMAREDIDGFKPYRSYVELDLRNLRWLD